MPKGLHTIGQSLDDFLIPLWRRVVLHGEDADARMKAYEQLILAGEDPAALLNTLRVQKQVPDEHERKLVVEVLSRIRGATTQTHRRSKQLVMFAEA